MKTNKVLNSMLAVMATTMLISCSSSDPDIEEKSHVDAANLFVEQLNEMWIDGEKYEDDRFRLAKAQTKMGADSGYIVVMDRNPDEGYYNSNSGATYFAVSIKGWNTYKDAHRHMAKEINYDNAFFNLIDLKNGDYEDYDTGLVFLDEAEACQGDARVCGAQKELLALPKVAMKLKNDHGMSMGLAMKAASAMVGYASSNDHSPEAGAKYASSILGKNVTSADIECAMSDASCRNSLLEGLSKQDATAVMNIAAEAVINAK